MSETDELSNVTLTATRTMEDFNTGKPMEKEFTHGTMEKSMTGSGIKD